MQKENYFSQREDNMPIEDINDSIISAVYNKDNLLLVIQAMPYKKVIALLPYMATSNEETLVKTLY